MYLDTIITLKVIGDLSTPLHTMLGLEAVFCLEFENRISHVSISNYS